MSMPADMTWNSPQHLTEPVAGFYDNMIAMTSAQWNLRSVDENPADPHYGVSPITGESNPNYQNRVLAMRRAAWYMANSIYGGQNGVATCVSAATAYTSGTLAITFVTPFIAAPTLILGSLVGADYGTGVAGLSVYVLSVATTGFTIKWAGANPAWGGGTGTFSIPWQALGRIS